MAGAESSSGDRLVEAVLEFLVGQDLVPLPDIRVELKRQVDAAGVDAVLALKARLSTDNGWTYYPRDPLAHEVHHRLADRFLAPGSEVRGIQHLAGLAGQPVVLFSNHLSYADANAIEVLLRRFGGADVADRLTALAGPKVFTSRERRFSSLCFGTVKVPQSTEVSSEEAVLDAREVARAAKRSIDVALERLRSGDALLLFGEGTRSRTAAMQPMLPAVARYLAVPGTWVVPVGLTGPEQLFSVEDAKLRPARVVVHVGAPVRAEALLASARRDRAVVMHAIGLAIAELLPETYRGAYREAGAFADAARVVREARRVAANDRPSWSSDTGRTGSDQPASGVTRFEFEQLQERWTAEDERDKLSNRSTLRLAEFYRALEDSDRSAIDCVLIDWLCSADPSKRFDAQALIREFTICSALPSLRASLVQWRRTLSRYPDLKRGGDYGLERSHALSAVHILEPLIKELERRC